MKVEELIKKLQEKNPQSEVMVWDAFHDCETDKVEVTEWHRERGLTVVMIWRG